MQKHENNELKCENDNFIHTHSTSECVPIDETSSDKKHKNVIKRKKIDMSNLSLFTKLCFAAAGLPYQMYIIITGIYISPFLLEIAQLRPTQISIVIFIARCCSAIADPLAGLLVSKMNTRFGKLRPWFLLATPFCVTCYMMFWYLPEMSQFLKLFWYLIFFCFFKVFLSCFRVTYTALTMYLTPNQKDRDSATTFRIIFELVGLLGGAVTQGLMISLYGSRISCNTVNITANDMVDNLNQTWKDTSYNKLGEGYLVSAGFVSALFIICSCTTFFGTKELNDVIEDKDKKFFSALKTVFTYKSYVTLLLAFLCAFVTLEIIQANFILYCKYAIDAKSSYQILPIVLLLASIISLPVWNFLMKKIGKKTTYALGLSLVIPNLIILTFLTNNQVWLLYIITAVTGFGSAVNFLLPWSMLPDVIDEFSLVTGTRRESIFYSFYEFFPKITSSIVVGLSIAFLDLGGYRSCPNGCCTQPASVGKTVKLLLIPGPLILLLIALVCIWMHPINAAKRKEIKQTLNDLREKHNLIIDNEK